MYVDRVTARKIPDVPPELRAREPRVAPLPVRRDDGRDDVLALAHEEPAGPLRAAGRQAGAGGRLAPPVARARHAAARALQEAERAVLAEDLAGRRVAVVALRGGRRRRRARGGLAGALARGLQPLEPLVARRLRAARLFECFDMTSI